MHILFKTDVLEPNIKTFNFHELSDFFTGTCLCKQQQRGNNLKFSIQISVPRRILLSINLCPRECLQLGQDELRYTGFFKSTQQYTKNPIFI